MKGQRGLYYLERGFPLLLKSHKNINIDCGKEESTVHTRTHAHTHTYIYIYTHTHTLRPFPHKILRVI
jgi:hypothetical protein